MSEQAAIGQMNAKLAPKATLVKLIIFSLSLGIVPLTSYFASLRFVWNGNSNFAAITAIVAANIVLVLYIITSLLEDKQSTDLKPLRSTPTPESKKER